MDQVCFALPVITGKTEDAAHSQGASSGLARPIRQSRKSASHSEESWYLQKTTMADLLMATWKS